MGFPTRHQPRSCVTPNFPKMGFRYPNVSFFSRNFHQKPLKVCYKVSLSKNFRTFNGFWSKFLGKITNLAIKVVKSRSRSQEQKAGLTSTTKYTHLRVICLQLGCNPVLPVLLTCTEVPFLQNEQ